MVSSYLSQLFFFILLFFFCALPLSAQDCITFYRAGLQYDNEGKIDMAHQMYDKAINCDSNLYDAYIKRGLLQYYEDEPMEALEDFKKAILIDSSNVTGYIHKFMAYYGIKKYEEGIRESSALINKHIRNPDLYNARGVNYLMLDMDSSALSDFKNAHTMVPNSIEFIYNIGLTYENLKLFDEALKSYRQALKINSKDIESLLGVASAYIYKKKYKNSIAYCKKALKVNPESSTAYDLWAFNLEMLKKYDAAFEKVNKAIQLDSTNSSAYSTLAELYSIKGDDENFYANIEKAFELGYKLAKDSPAIDVYQKYFDKERFKKMVVFD